MLAVAVPGGESRHQDAVIGAVRVLRRGHIPFSIETQLDNERLEGFSVVILPDARRLSNDDIFTVRAYVAEGGFLLHSDGSISDDFALADVFGCIRVATEEGVMVYLRPKTPSLEAAMRPEPFLPSGGAPTTFGCRCAAAASTYLGDQKCVGDRAPHATLRIPV